MIGCQECGCKLEEIKPGWGKCVCDCKHGGRDEIYCMKTRKELEIEYSRILGIDATPEQIKQARIKAAEEANR